MKMPAWGALVLLFLGAGRAQFRGCRWVWRESSKPCTLVLRPVLVGCAYVLAWGRKGRSQWLAEAEMGQPCNIVLRPVLVGCACVVQQYLLAVWNWLALPDPYLVGGLGRFC